MDFYGNWYIASVHLLLGNSHAAEGPIVADEQYELDRYLTWH